MKEASSRAANLTLATILVGLVVGGSALGMGVAEGTVALWGFGAACLLQVPPALSLRGRIRDGLGNSGLERERITLRVVSHLLRLVALGMAMASISALLGERAPQASLSMLGLAALAFGCTAGLWYAKQGVKGVHPTLDLDAARTRTLLELAAILFVGQLLGRWFPWADAASGLAQALRLFFEARNLSKASTLQATCGGCGCSCG